MAWRPALCAFLAVASLAVQATAAGNRPAAMVHVVVTDASGRSVPNLAASDIEIRSGGDRIPVASLAFGGAVPRKIALFLDDYHVTAGAPADRTIAAARTFLDRHVRAEDTVFLMRPLDSQQTIAPVATLDEARRRVAAFRGRRGDYTPAGEFEAEYMSTAPRAAARERAQIVCSALQALATAMRDPVEAPKALVVVTEGFESADRRRARTATLQTIARVARIANIAVYVIDPSVETVDPSPFAEGWTNLTSHTAGALFAGGADIDASVGRIAADLASRYVVGFETPAAEDGRFHDIDVRVKRRGAIVRAPSGYWAPFAESRFTTPAPGSTYASLLTPHLSGLILPWFRMAPGSEGKTRVTFLWTRRPAGAAAAAVGFKALTFEGNDVHEATVSTNGQTSFEAAPGPLQISMAVSSGTKALLDTDVRYIDVPSLAADRPVIVGVEFIRPRSLPEFTALAADPAAVPTAVRDFLRQDRLLIRVRAFAGQRAADVRARLLNRNGDVLMPLPVLPSVDDASQFELPLARFPRGEYRIDVRAESGGRTIAQMVSIRLIG